KAVFPNYAACSAMTLTQVWCPGNSLSTRITSGWAWAATRLTSAPHSCNLGRDWIVTMLLSMSEFESSVLFRGKLPCTVTCDKEEGKTIEHGRLSAVLDGKESFRLMCHEISHSHLAGRDKSCKPGKQSQQDQYATPELDDGGGEHHGIMQLGMSAERAE